MATNFTFTSLCDDLSAYLERARKVDSDAYLQRPRIINLAEDLIITELKLQGYERTLLWDLEAGVSVYAKPDRHRETLSMQVEVAGKIVTLFPRGYEYLTTVYPDDAQGVPAFYADHGARHWIIGPNPAADYTCRTKIYQLPKLLGEDTQTNWLTEENGPALLYRSLKEMALFLKKYDEAQVFEAEYGKAISGMATQDSKKLMDRAAERDGA
jgi:gamma-glutamyl phosphate reductase